MFESHREHKETSRGISGICGWIAGKWILPILHLGCVSQVHWVCREANACIDAFLYGGYGAIGSATDCGSVGCEFDPHYPPQE